MTIAASTILKPGQHYLVAATGSSVEDDANRTFTPGIDDNGGVALFNFSGTVQDMAGMCATTTYREGTFPFAPFTGKRSINPGYERKPVGAASCYDTNDNARDFALIEPADPAKQRKPDSYVRWDNRRSHHPSHPPARRPAPPHAPPQPSRAT